MDNAIHNVSSDSGAADGQQYYSDMSIWDIFRTQFPWLTFFVPTVARDVVRSLVLMYKQG